MHNLFSCAGRTPMMEKRISFLALQQHQDLNYTGAFESLPDFSNQRHPEHTIKLGDLEFCHLKYNGEVSNIFGSK